MNPKVLKLIKRGAWCLLGGLLTIISGGIWLLNDKPDLSVWHTARLDEEFTRWSKVDRFEEYLELEDRLFLQLEKEVYDKVEGEDPVGPNRYSRESVSHPARWERNWNRSFELAQAEPVAGILMIHGLTDSPYSMRGIAETLHRSGAYVLAMRVPGHGTAPSSLAETGWRDMEAAIEIGVRHVAEKASGLPFYIVGYSNGGALAVRYVINSIKGDDLPGVDGLVLLSPEIGVAKMAGFAIWQERVGKVFNLKKLRWTGLMIEYDPFKYSSFPVNGGVLAHDLTRINRRDMARLAKAGKLKEFPPTIAFQSAVDATVMAPALVQDFFFPLPEGGHELIIYDLNRIAGIEPILANDPKKEIGPIIESPRRNFAVTVLTNASEGEKKVDALIWNVGTAQSRRVATGLSWPPDVYSLSHVALPFSVRDHLYGVDGGKGRGMTIGTVAPKGEKGALKIPASDLLRLRWNPFFDYQEARILEHFGLASKVDP